MRLLVVTLSVCALWANSTLETRVLQQVQRIHERDGRVVFSELYNSDEFSPEERAFLGRLYEIFFAIPAFLKAELDSTGTVPTRGEIARSFGVGIPVVDLLLGVMERDRRVPPLFTRESSGGEISSLNLDEETRDRFGNVNVYPTLFFVTEDGAIFRHLVNFQSEERLSSVIEELLGP